MAPFGTLTWACGPPQAALLAGRQPPGIRAAAAAVRNGPPAGPLCSIPTGLEPQELHAGVCCVQLPVFGTASTKFGRCAAAPPAVDNQGVHAQQAQPLLCCKNWIATCCQHIWEPDSSVSFGRSTSCHPCRHVKQPNKQPNKEMCQPGYKVCRTPQNNLQTAYMEAKPCCV